MEVKQIHTLLNNVTQEILGKESVANEDLSNVIDAGNEIFNASSVDNYVKSLVNQIGKIIFVNRSYAGGAPSVLMDNWEYGSVIEKISAEMPAATENESWELENGRDYSPNVFHKPEITTKFFNKRVTFEVDLSFTEKQVKESFTSAAQLNGFMSMLYNSVEKSMTVKIDSLIMRTINNMIAETIYSDYGTGDLSAKSGIKAVNLYKLFTDYISQVGTSVGGGVESMPTLANAIYHPAFIRFAVNTISIYIDRLSKISALFNISGKDRFTTRDMLKIVMLTDFKTAAGVYLNADTVNENYITLPNAETVPYWQGSGTDYAFNSVSSINVKTSGNHTVETSGILAVMFDRDALGVTNLDRRVTTHYNAKAEFFNNFYKFDAGYFNDFNENFVVFFIA